MGGLAHFLEDEGLATTHISLVRPQTENTRPPRALWVPFELGRPMGAPNEPEFQTRVLRAALALLERVDGPVLIEDFPDDAPPDLAARDGYGWVCPISLPPLPADLKAGGGFRAAMETEIAGLATWHDMARRDRGRSTMGLSQMTIEGIAEFICAFLDGETPDNPRDDVTLAHSLKFATEDLKTYYREAASAHPGANTGRQMNDWFYGETAGGKALYALRPMVRELAEQRDDAFMKIFGERLLIPAQQMFRVES